MSGDGILSDALDLVHGDLTRYVRLPSPEAADAVTLWIAATHCQHLWEHATRLVVKSPVKRCGKTRLAEVVRELVHRPEVAGSISAAALVRIIDEHDPPTVILDEADAVFKKRSAGDEGAEALRQILNLGHSRGWPYKRWDAKKRDVEECATFAMALIAGIGDMPDTIEDRAVVIAMQRRAPGETVAEFRRHNTTDLRHLRETLSHAIKLTIKRYDSYEPPELPVEDRAADVWEPLVAVADEAGGAWPARARLACIALTGEAHQEDQNLSLRLLSDIRTVWTGDKMFSADLIRAICEIEDAPWSDWWGKEITGRRVSDMLRDFEIRSRKIRIGEETRQGYRIEDLEDAWSRYLPSSGFQSGTWNTPGQSDFSDDPNESVPLSQFPISSIATGDVPDVPLSGSDSQVEQVEPDDSDPAPPTWDEAVQNVLDAFPNTEEAAS